MKTKKISELTMMETVSDAANVLVEENGEAKRVPAGKILPEHLRFGETVEMGDTLTWDGNTEGLTGVDFGSDAAYKVSDAVFSTEDCVNGVNSSLKLPDMVIQEECVISNFNGVTYVNCGNFPAVYSVPPECVGVDFYGVTFPEAGTYLAKAPFYHCSSLTIPGFGGFVTKTVKPIDTKFLPEHLQFGETVVGPDTLTWDGNKEGHVVVTKEYQGSEYWYVKVSDNTPTMADFANGASVKAFSRGFFEPVEVHDEGNAIAVADFAAIILEDNVSLFEVVFPEKGIYFLDDPSYGTTEALRIPGYTGFPTKTVVKPIDKKYLPGAASCTNFYNAQEDDYIYTDKACSIKASKNDVVEALSRGIIYLCSSENTHSIVGRVSFFDGYAKLLAIDITNGNVHAYDYYSAEHIAAGPS